MLTKNEITDLEREIEALLHCSHELAQENSLLRKKLAATLQKKAILLNKEKKITFEIKQIISQIKNELT